MEFDEAQICLNGHVANPYYRTVAERNRKFCSRCGESAIHACPECCHAIRGKGISVAYASTRYQAPLYCEDCGQPFPWTSRSIQAVLDLAALELTKEDQEILQHNVEDVVKDAPSTRVAAIRIKTVLVRAGGTLSESIRELLVDIASETAKKVIWGK